MNEFKREQRYIVLKIKDLIAVNLTQAETDAINLVFDKVSMHRMGRGAGLLECVVVEKDWPEYQPTWAAIEKRCSCMPDSCPHAAPFRYCPECVATPCPIGLGKKA